MTRRKLSILVGASIVVSRFLAVECRAWSFEAKNEANQLCSESYYRVYARDTALTPKRKRHQKKEKKDSASKNGNNGHRSNRNATANGSS